MSLASAVPCRQDGGLCAEVQHVLFQALVVGGVFMYCAVPITLVIFTGPKMASGPQAMSREAVTVSQSLYWLGYALGCGVVMPRVRSFRRPAYAMLAGALVAMYGSTLTTDAALFALCSLAMGFLLPSSSQILYILMMESVPEQLRPLLSSSLNAGFSFLEIMVAASCEATQGLSWREETRLWYLPPALLLVCGLAFTEDPAAAAGEGAAAGAGALEPTRLWGPQWRRCTALTCLCWSACAVGYYGLTYSAGNLSPDVYVNVELMGLVDIAGYTVASMLAVPLGARGAQCLSFLLAAVALFACSIMPPDSWELVACALTGRLFITTTFTTVYVLLVETFPQDARCGASGFANFIGRLSSLLAPFCSWLPAGLSCWLLGLLALAASAATALLPKSPPRKLLEAPLLLGA